jgi:tetraacyldisaccharide 4'-kinase
MNIFKNRFYQILLIPLSIIYAFVIWLRNKLYDKKIFRSLKIDQCKLISVGNISVGGTGKTPVIKFLAGYLSEMGFKVAILSRGYRRSSKGTIIVSDGNHVLAGLKDAGDEPFLLAQQLKNIPIVVEGDRYNGAVTIREKFQPHIILLDDAYQHRRLQRDFDIVLVDASVGFGRGLLLPAGFLREPVKNLNRADLIWFTRIDQSNNFDMLASWVNRYTSRPMIISEHRANTIIQASTNKQYQLSYLNQKQILLFSGIANPRSFEKTVIGLGAKVVHHLLFSDHYQYQQTDINKILKKAGDLDTDVILTTEKDFVRIVNVIQNITNIYYLTIDIWIGNCSDVLKQALSSVLFETCD